MVLTKKSHPHSVTCRKDIMLVVVMHAFGSRARKSKAPWPRLWATFGKSFPSSCGFTHSKRRYEPLTAYCAHLAWLEWSTAFRHDDSLVAGRTV